MAAAEATSAMEGREGGGEGVRRGVEVVKREEEVGGVTEQGNTAGRKMKSLALLCKRFVSLMLPISSYSYLHSQVPEHRGDQCGNWE